MNRVSIMPQPVVARLRLVGVQHMPFKLVAEMADGGSDRPGSGIAQRADGVAFDLRLDIPQQVDIAHLSFSVFNIVQDLLHPARSLAAGRALSAAFVAVKARERE